MPIRLLLIALTVWAILGLTVPRSASALSCISLADVVAMMDVIVRGRIMAIPSNGVLELSVSHYYRGGSGAAQLSVEVPGLGQGQRMDWYSVPQVGDELIIGFVRRGETLVNEACHLFVQLGPGQEPPQELKEYLGDSEAPVGAVQVERSQESPTAAEGEDRFRHTLLWATFGGLVLIGLGSWKVWRWRR